MLPITFYVRSRIFGYYSGFSWFVFIWITRSVKEREKVVINHERIHFRQQLEMLFIPHWVLYVWYYFNFRMKGLDHNKAYLNNPFEREAYENEGNPRYLVSRPKFAWRQYGRPRPGDKRQTQRTGPVLPLP